jgi:hypothetical protein
MSMDAPKPETSGVQPPVTTTVPKETVVSPTDSKATSQKAPTTLAKEEGQSKSTTSPASDVNKPATSTSTSTKPPVANTTMEPKQPPAKQSFTMGVAPQASASSVPLANFKKATTPAIPKVPLSAVANQPSSNKPVETRANPPAHSGSAKLSASPATAKPSNPPKKEEVAPAKPANESKQEEEQSASPPKQAEKASSVRPPTPNLAQPQTLLTRSLINPNFVDAQVSAKRRLRGEQDDEEDEMQKESIFSRASKIMLQKQAEEDTLKKQQATKATSPPPSQKQKNPPPPAPKPDKHVPVVEEYVEPAIKEEDLVDNHRLPASPTESFHSVQAPIKESRAHMPSRTNRQGRTSASSTRHVAPAFSHAPKQSTKQSLPKYERDRSASSKQYRRGNTRQEEEDVEEIDTENLARVQGGGNSHYENALFDDLRASAYEFFRPSTHPSMHFDVNDDDNSQNEEDSEYDSSEYLGSSYEGEDFDYGEEDGEYDSQEEEDEEGEEEDYSDQPTEGEGEGVAHQSSLPALKEMADINNHPKALIRLFADCEEQTALVEVLGKMRRFMAEFKDAFIKSEHEAIKELCISENEIAQEMMSEYEAQLKAFKERVLFLNAMARMIDIRHSFYEQFKTTFSRHEPLTQTFETFDSELSESFHKEKQMMHRKERRHSAKQDESSSKHKRRHKHAAEDQISESEDRHEEAPQPHLPTEAEYFAQKKKFEAEQAQLQAYAAERLRRESAGEQPHHRTKSHHSHRADAGKHSTSQTKSSHRSSRR